MFMQAEAVTSMIKMISVLVVAIFGCRASTAVPQYPNISEKQYVENKPLPARPDAEKIPADKDWVKPLAAGQCTQQDGVLLSPDKAGRVKLWQESYNALRDMYDLDRQIWQQHRIVYDERITQANAEIKRRSPSWWDEHSASISWAAGFIIGAATTVTIVYGLDNIR